MGGFIKGEDSTTLTLKFFNVTNGPEDTLKYSKSNMIDLRRRS